MSDFHQGLNAGQTEAVKHFTGPMMALAGPGSGKTTVITHRVRYLIEHYQIQPERILVVTFSRAAAEEMSRRYAAMVNGGGKAYFATFHSFFFTILRRSGKYAALQAAGGDGQRESLKKAVRAAGLPGWEEEDFLNACAAEISLVKNELISIEDYVSMEMGAEEFREVFRLYHQSLAKEGKIDFDDMLVQCYNLLMNDSGLLQAWRSRFDFILVDEFQDINRAQYETIKLIAQPKNNIFVVGDDDQSIYRFRGARPEFLLNFTKEFPGTKSVLLDVNYRSTDEIINLSHHVISSNKARYQKLFTGQGEQGDAPVLIQAKDPKEEAEYIAQKIWELSKETPFENIGVIYRTNMQARAFIDVFFALRLPFSIKDETPNIYDHWIARDICAYMKLALHRDDNGALARIINKPSRYIRNDQVAYASKQRYSALHTLLNTNILDKRRAAALEELVFYLNSIQNRSPYETFRFVRKAVGYDKYIDDYANYRKIAPHAFHAFADELQEAAKACDSLPSYLLHVEEAGRQLNELNASRQGGRDKGVNLTTMHSAKGLEFEAVFVAGAVEGIVPYERARSPREIEEERRLFYVALTRAKKRLYISLFKSRYDSEKKPSRFLDGLL